MASLVLPDVVCGNKVPTVEFPNDSSEARLFLWLAIVNSFSFDWLVRRVVTTTVNYFVLRSLRLPKLEILGVAGTRLIQIARQLDELDDGQDTSFELCWCVAKLRAEADVIVATAYGCTERDLRLLMNDFPLLDRGQPPLPGEDRSTVTFDLLLSTWHRQRGRTDTLEGTRLRMARERGAIGYLSSEFCKSTRASKEGTYGRR